MRTHKNGSTPLTNEVFVFGSNLAGHHGAGAAKYARDHLGAEYGVGVGMTGRCYAIPTKDFTITTMSLGDIERYVHKFVEFTNNYPNVNFFITAIGTGLAGYKHKHIAPMFKGITDNCSVPEEWVEFLN